MSTIASDLVRDYVRMCRREHCDELGDEGELLVEDRDELWSRMTSDERDTANALVELLLGDLL